MQVLVVEDVPVTREILCAAAQSAFPGAIVQSARDLREGLEIAGRGPRVDLVLLDLGLPDSSGIACIPRLKAACPHARLLVVSCEEGEDIEAAAMNAGANGFVMKTATTPAILAALCAAACAPHS